MGIIFKRPQGRQPQGVVQLDGSNPLNQRAAFVWTPTRSKELVQQSAWSLSGSTPPTLSATPSGVATKHTSGAATVSYVDLGTPTGSVDLGTIPCTYVGVFYASAASGVCIAERNDANAANIGWVMGYVSGNNAGTYGLGFVQEHGTTNSRKSISNAVVAGLNVLVVTYDGGLAAAGINVYLNGVLGSVNGSQDGVGTTGTDAARNLYVGRCSYDTSRSHNGSILLAGAFKRIWSVAEIVNFSRNPWQLFASPARQLLVDSGGGTTITNAGAAQAASQAVGGVVGVVSAVAQAAAQAAGGSTQVVLGQAQAASQAARGPVVVVLGAGQAASQAVGVGITAVAGVGAAASQAAGSVVETVAGAAQAAGQASGQVIDVTSGSAQAASQASASAVAVVKGEAQSAGQAAGAVGSSGTTVIAAGESQSASQAAGAVVASVAGNAQAAAQAARSAVVVASGQAQSVGQAEGVGFSPVTFIVPGVSASYSQADGAVGAASVGGNAWEKKQQKRRAQVQAEVNARNLEILKADLVAEAQAAEVAQVVAVAPVTVIDDEDEEDILMLLL